MQAPDAPVPTTPPFVAHLAQFRHSPPSPSLSRSVLPSPAASPTPTRRKRSLPEPQLPPRASSSPYFATARSAKPSASGAGAGDPPVPSPKKRKKPARPYADPSVYAHLEGLTDFLAPGLDVVLCGINPGVKSAELGQHYAGPTNHYYKVLHGSGFTPHRLLPSEGHLLPLHYSVGATNLVPRPSAEASELSKAEMRENVPRLVEKLVRYRPRVVAFVGLAIADVVRAWFRDLSPAAPTCIEPKPSPTFSLPSLVAKPSSVSSRKKLSASSSPRKKALGKTTNGLQPLCITFPNGAPRLYFWALPSTSARVVAYQIADKIELWIEMREAIRRVKEGEVLSCEGMVEWRVEDVLGSEWDSRCKLQEDMVKSEPEVKVQGLASTVVESSDI